MRCKLLYKDPFIKIHDALRIPSLLFSNSRAQLHALSWEYPAGCFVHCAAGMPHHAPGPGMHRNYISITVVTQLECGINEQNSCKSLGHPISKLPTHPLQCTVIHFKITGQESLHFSCQLMLSKAITSDRLLKKKSNCST